MPTSASAGPPDCPTSSWWPSHRTGSRATTRSSGRRTTSADACWPAIRDLTEEEYADLVGALGTATITELTVLVGYYRTLADLLAVYDVGVPD